MKIIEYRNINTGVVVSEDELTEEEKEELNKSKEWKKEWIDVD